MQLKIGDWVEVIAEVESMNFEPCKGQFGMIADEPINGIYPIRLEGTSAYLSADKFRQANKGLSHLQKYWYCAKWLHAWSGLHLSSRPPVTQTVSRVSRVPCL